MPGISRWRTVHVAVVLVLSLCRPAGAQVSSPAIVEVVETFGCQNGLAVAWTVPPTVSQVMVSMAGAEGGTGAGGRAGGQGGSTESGNEPVMDVAPGELYHLMVGCRGQNGASGGSGGAGFGNGGDGAGSPSAGGGGGASALLDSTNTALIVAGGGGGGTIHSGSFAGSFGGAGGGADGGAGVNGGGSYQGGGGTQTQAGAGGDLTGIIGCPCPGNDGDGPHGGDGVANGGGGGGGLFGGGGGGAQIGASSNLGGGGGGSGHIAPGLSGSLVSGTRTGNGFVTLTYDAAIDPQFTVAIVFDLVAGGPAQLTRFDVTNAGGAPAPAPELTVQAPPDSGVVFDDTHVEFEVPAGWSCLVAPGGASITCIGPTLSPGASATFFLPVAALPGATSGSVSIAAEIASSGAVGSVTRALEVTGAEAVPTMPVWTLVLLAAVLAQASRVAMQRRGRPDLA